VAGGFLTAWQDRSHVTVPTLTAIYLDFQDPFSHRAWKWVSLLPERASVEVRPYSLDGESNPWDREQPSTGLELLALGELARETGRDVHLAFIDAAFAAVHDHEADASSVEAWLALGSKVGLDLDAFTADAERWRAEVGLWHEEARDECGVFGVPTTVWDGEHALFLRLLDADLDAERARRLLDDLADLVVQPVKEVRRTV
jgi:hypothetical protein